MTGFEKAPTEALVGFANNQRRRLREIGEAIAAGVDPHVPTAKGGVSLAGQAGVNAALLETLLAELAARGEDITALAKI